MDDYSEEHASSGTNSSFKDLVMSQMNRIAQYSSCELRGGYTTYLVDKTGKERELWVEDTRERLSNSIYCLAQLLRPKFDKKTKQAFTEFEESHQRIDAEFISATTVQETVILSESFYVNPRDKVFLAEYRTKKLKLYRDLMFALAAFLDSKKYFEMGGGDF